METGRVVMFSYACFQIGRFIDEVFEFFTALEYLVDVLRHDAFHTVHLILQVIEIVGVVVAIASRCLSQIHDFKFFEIQTPFC